MDFLQIEPWYTDPERIRLYAGLLLAGWAFGMFSCWTLFRGLRR